MTEPQRSGDLPPKHTFKEKVLNVGKRVGSLTTIIGLSLVAGTADSPPSMHLPPRAPATGSGLPMPPPGSPRVEIQPTTPTSTERKPETLIEEQLVSLKQLNQNILDKQVSSDPEELEQWYLLAKSRQQEMMKFLIEHYDQARDFIKDPDNVKAREKLEALFTQNQDTMVQDIFNRPGQGADVITGIEGLTERKVTNLSGTAYSVADAPPSFYQTPLKFYDANFDQLDSSSVLWTDQNLPASPMHTDVSEAYVIGNAAIARKKDVRFS